MWLRRRRSICSIGSRQKMFLIIRKSQVDGFVHTQSTKSCAVRSKGTVYDHNARKEHKGFKELQTRVQGRSIALHTSACELVCWIIFIMRDIGLPIHSHLTWLCDQFKTPWTPAVPDSSTGISNATFKRAPAGAGEWRIVSRTWCWSEMYSGRSRLEESVLLSEILATVGLSEDNDTSRVQTFCLGRGASSDTETKRSARAC